MASRMASTVKKAMAFPRSLSLAANSANWSFRKVVLRGSIGQEFFPGGLEPVEEPGGVAGPESDDECFPGRGIGDHGGFYFFAEGGVIKIFYDADDALAAVDEGADGVEKAEGRRRRIR